MYIMKRTDIIFNSRGEKVKSTLEELKLNEVLGIEDNKLKRYRIIKGKDFYDVESSEWEKIKSLYEKIVKKEMINTVSYEVATKNATTVCYINEDDYCSLVRKLDLEDYSLDGDVNYRYYVETKSLITKTDMQFEIEEEIYNFIKNMND